MQYFRPSLSYQLLLSLFLSSHFTQVLPYTICSLNCSVKENGTKDKVGNDVDEAPHLHVK